MALEKKHKDFLHRTITETINHKILKIINYVKFK